MKGKFNFGKTIITSLVGGLWFAGTADAVPVQFNLRDTAATADIEDGSVTRGGITATLTPLVSGNTGTLNQVAGSFGIDATNNGTPHDESALLDGVDGAESVSIVFDFDVHLLGASLSSLGGTEQVSIRIGSFPSVALSDTGFGTDTYSFASDNYVPVGLSVVLTWVGGNGFSFDSFTVEKLISSPPAGNGSVPDAGASLALLGLSISSLGLLLRCRNHR